MGAPGLQLAGEAGQLGGCVEAGDDLVLGARSLAAGDHGHPQRVGAVAPDRGVDDAVWCLGVLPDQGVVAATGGVGGELLDQVLGGIGGAGDDQQAGAARVEAVDDARALRVADIGQLPDARQQTVDERAVGVAGTGMDDHPGGLVDHDDVVVDVHDLERDAGVGLRWADARHLGHVDLDGLAGGEAHLAGRGDGVVDTDPAGLDDRHRRRAADVGEQRHDAVQTFAAERGRDLLTKHGRNLPRRVRRPARRR
jgi:hypothetical protein